MRTIRQQLLLSLLGGTMLCTVTAGGALFWKVREEANELFDAQLKQVAVSLPPALSPQAELVDKAEPEADILIQVWDIGGRLLYSSYPASSMPHYSPTGFRTVHFRHDQWRIYSEAQRDRFVQVAQPIGTRTELAAEVAFRSLLPFIALLPVLAALIWFVVGRSLQPLQRVARAVSLRSPSALQPLVTDGLPPEVTPMLDALNDLLRQLDHALASQQAFVADAAHELRSPLTALKLQLQLAERATNEQQRMIAFGKLHDRLDRSSHLVHQLLTLARQDHGQEVQAMERVDLLALARKVVAEHRVLAESKAINLGVRSGEARIVVSGKADSLCILLSNLVDNALRYTPHCGRVDVNAFVGAEGVRLQVADSGPGIATADRPRVFDRFYRSEGSDVSGSGLGLSIVQRIANLHGATVHLNDNPGTGGLLVTVLFFR
jgi:two-component system OmpR family sensor kinase